MRRDATMDGLNEELLQETGVPWAQVARQHRCCESLGRDWELFAPPYPVCLGT